MPAAFASVWSVFFRLCSHSTSAVGKTNPTRRDCYCLAATTARAASFRERHREAREMVNVTSGLLAPRILALGARLRNGSTHARTCKVYPCTPPL